MRLIFLLLTLLALGGCAASYPPAPSVPRHSDNTVQPGDELQIVILDEQALSGVYKVDARGAVTLPLAGRIRVQGLTLTQASNSIAATLAKGYLKQPHLAVSFARQRDVYVLGEVQRPGNYPYSPHLTVVKAVAQAGGYTYRAAKQDMLLRRQNGEKPVRKYTADEDTPLSPGDSLTVGERFF